MLTALMMPGCPEALMRWLVAHGASLTATNVWGATALHVHACHDARAVRVLLELGADVHGVGRTRGSTPLHMAAHARNVEAAKVLLAAGAAVDAKETSGETPLESGLARCSRDEIRETLGVVELLLAAGAQRTPEMKAAVRQIGERFESHRTNVAAEIVDAVAAALARLYEIFEVEPVPPRVMHDGTSPIAVTATTWEQQHDELWDLLVPGSGPAATVQGEVIRISGRLAHELLDNGGGNWNRDFTRMARAFGKLTRMGTALRAKQASDRDQIVESLVTSAYVDFDRLRELAVAWVLANPQPIAHCKPDYAI